MLEFKSFKFLLDDSELKSVIYALFPDATICELSAAMYYGYTDRVPGIWHIVVDNKSDT
jgi:hypothetical protein